MTRASDIVDRVIADLHGYGGTQDRVTTLSGSIGTADLTFTVTDSFGQAVGLTPGVIQIDSELLYAKSIDPSTNIVTLTNFGRGHLNSVPAAHAAGAAVISRPTWPRKDVFGLVNDVIGSLYPSLFAVSTDETLTFSANTDTYVTASGDLRRILDLSWVYPPLFTDYVHISRYRIDPYNQAIRIYDQIVPDGATLRVAYATVPDTFASESDDISATGLPDSCAELLRLGVLARMLPGLDISRAQKRSADAVDRAGIPPNSGITTAHVISAQFDARLKSEALALRELYPVQIVHTY